MESVRVIQDHRQLESNSQTLTLEQGLLRLQKLFHLMTIAANFWALLD